MSRHRGPRGAPAARPQAGPAGPSSCARGKRGAGSRHRSSALKRGTHLPDRQPGGPSHIRTARKTYSVVAAVARPRLRRETLIPASCPAWLRGAPEEKTRCLRSQIHVAAPSYRLQPAIFLVTRDLMICGPRSVPRCSSPHSPRHQTIAGRCLAIDVNLARHQASSSGGLAL